MDQAVLPARKLASEEKLELPTLSNSRARSRSKTCFDCQHCSKTFPSKQECREHEALHFRERRFQCSVCSKTFLKHAHLREHARIHSGERPFHCNLCTMDFVTSGALFAHKLSYHPESLFYCNNCGRKFQKEASLDLHRCGPRKRIVRAQPLTSSGAEERSQSALAKKRGKSKHYTRTLNALAYRCNICDKRFFAPKSVVRHKQIYHSRHKSSSKLVLPKRLKSMGVLSSTKVAATKVKKGSKYKSISSGHRCPTCGMGFRVPSVLQRHMKTHTGEDTYTCHICGKSIRRFDGLQSHMRQHTGNAIHTCLYCDMFFDAIVRLKRHMRSVHGKVPNTHLRCKICSKFFVNDQDLQRHMEIGIHAVRDQFVKGEKMGDNDDDDDEEAEEEGMEEDNEDNDESTPVIIEINTDPGFHGMGEDDEDPDAAEVEGSEEAELAGPAGRGLIQRSDGKERAGCRDGSSSGVANEEEREEPHPASIRYIKQEADPELSYMSDINAMKAALDENEGLVSTDVHDDDSLVSAAVVKHNILDSEDHPSGNFSGEEEKEKADYDVDIGQSEPLAHSTLEEGEISQTDNDLEDCFWVDYTHTGTKKGTRYICKFCRKQFRDVTQVRDHSWVHTGVKRHKCNLCGKDFTASCSLRVHLRNVHSQLDIPDGRYAIKQDDTPPKKSPGASSYQSTTISPTSEKSPMARQHLKELVEEERKSAEIEVSPSSQTAGPQASRTKGQRIKCLECPKTFIDMTHLRNHMWVHTGVKLHKCIVCGKEFSTSGSLNVHKKSAHTEDQIIMAESSIDWESFSSSEDPVDQVSNNAADPDTSASNRASPDQFMEFSEEIIEEGNDGDDDDDDDCFQVLAAEEERIEIVGDEGKRHVYETEEAEDDSMDCLDANSSLHGGYQSEENLESREDEDQSVSIHSTTGQQLPSNLEEDAWQTVHIPGRKSRVGCPYCDKTFCDKANLRNHMWVHTGVKLHKCLFCSKTFTTSSSLHVHMRRTHDYHRVVNPVTGEIKYVTKKRQARGEGTSQVDSSRIAKHNLDSLHSASSSHDVALPQGMSYTGADPMMDTGCSQSTTSKYSLENTGDASMNSNDSENLAADEMFCSEPGTSSEASRRRARTANLRRRSHNLHCKGETLGKASFGRHSIIKSLRRLSRSQKQRIRCTRCEKTFSTMSHLRNHMWIHTGVKLHQCKICDKEFTTANSVKVHMRSMHSPTEMERVKDMSTQNPMAKHRGDRSNSSLSTGKGDDVEPELDEGNTSDGYPEIALSEEECEVDGVILLDGGDFEERCSADSDAESTQNDCSNPSDMRYMQIMNPSFSDEEETDGHRPGMSVKLERHPSLEAKVKQELCDSPNADQSHLSEEEEEDVEEGLVDENSREDVDNSEVGKAGRKLIACKVCKRTFPHRFHLKKHMAVHSGEKRYKCRFCKVKFTDSNTLVYHQQKVHGKDGDEMQPRSAGAVAASESGRAASSSGRAVSSSRKKLPPQASEEFSEACDGDATDMHQFESDYNNANSPFTSENPGELTPCVLETGGVDSVISRTSVSKVAAELDDSHQSISHGSAKLSSGESSSKLQVALRSDGGGKGTSSSVDQALRRVKKFKCEDCDKEFINKADCQDHMWQHTGVKRHVCPICEARFVSSGGLKTHFMKTHVDDDDDANAKDLPKPRTQMTEHIVQSGNGKGGTTCVTPVPKQRLLGPKSARNRRQLAMTQGLANSKRVSQTLLVSHTQKLVHTAVVDSEDEDDEACFEEPTFQTGIQMPEAAADFMHSFDCFICSQKFSTLEELDSHMLGHPLE